MLHRCASVFLLFALLARVECQAAPGAPSPDGSVHQQHVQFQQQQLNVKEGILADRTAGGIPLQFQQDAHNVGHILEHLDKVIKSKPKDQMSEVELEFYYFKMHDYDNNNKLDGLEIVTAVTHYDDDEDVAERANPPDGEDGGRKAPQKTLSDEEFANIVDAILTENDSNGDGYVEYFEFKRMQDRQRASEPKSP